MKGTVGSFTMTDGTISDNYADYGGGVALVDGRNEFYMAGGVIRNHQVEWRGGGVIAHWCPNC
jgi:hypothetical protein